MLHLASVYLFLRKGEISHWGWDVDMRRERTIRSQVLVSGRSSWPAFDRICAFFVDFQPRRASVTQRKDSTGDVQRRRLSGHFREMFYYPRRLSASIWDIHVCLFGASKDHSWRRNSESEQSHRADRNQRITQEGSSPSTTKKNISPRQMNNWGAPSRIDRTTTQNMTWLRNNKNNCLTYVSMATELRIKRVTRPTLWQECCSAYSSYQKLRARPVGNHVFKHTYLYPRLYFVNKWRHPYNFFR